MLSKCCLSTDKVEKHRTAQVVVVILVWGDLLAFCWNQLDSDVTFILRTAIYNSGECVLRSVANTMQYVVAILKSTPLGISSSVYFIDIWRSIVFQDFASVRSTSMLFFDSLISPPTTNHNEVANALSLLSVPMVLSPCKISKSFSLVKTMSIDAGS